ncbi:MAG TPA: ATP-grasp domain-containing protein [Actinophytocola sp.]|uniref:ATP-grasp domain-containing protein n=1 Tax=Actinophytocola sp. TaxID=1872138 RepID=UPI002DB74CF2|nr:ATP-grasp domain-containing protein [Actinophytocola sp.]HEU5470962.1 ATP-grasp domain-containing protein [Actinophytocola sp.]
MSTRPGALLIMTELKMIIRHLRIVEYARELGLVPVMVFSRADDLGRLRELAADPGHALSGLGELWPVPDVSVSAVLGSVPSLTDRYRVRGVISCGEYFVEAAAALAEALGRPGPGWSAAASSRNKLLQRCRLPEHSPRWRLIHPSARATVADLDWDWGGTLVVKPTGRMSSSGVREVAAPDELAGVVGDYPAGETLLVEHRVVGPEYSVESLVADGVLRWSGITAKRTNEGGTTFVEMSHLVPAPGLPAARAEELVRVNAEVLRRLGVRDAVTHAEYRCAGAGAVLMEVAVRVPGDGISVLWTLATGSSFEDRIVDVALGREVSYPRPVRRAGHVYLDHPIGTLVDVHGGDVPVSWTTRDERWPRLRVASPDAPPRRCAVLVSKLPGARLGHIVDSDARTASVLLDAPLGADIDAAARAAGTGVRIVVS